MMRAAQSVTRCFSLSGFAQLTPIVLGAVGALIALTNTAWSDMPVNQDSAEQAKYTCPKAQKVSEKLREAEELSRKKHDKNALACAAELRFEVTQSNPNDLEGKLAAHQALLEYVEHVLTLKEFDLVRINWEEYQLRLQRAQGMAEALRTRSESGEPEPRLAILRATLDARFAGPNQPDVKIASAESLQLAIARDPDVLDGLGQFTVGRIYLELPPLLGGGLEKALPFLETAQELRPTDPQRLRYVAQCYAELGRTEAALATLRTMANLSPQAPHWQLFADEWRMGEGLATLLGDTVLVDEFASLRLALLQEHPELLLRKVETVFGHGGNHPVTNEPQYSAEGVIRSEDRDDRD